MFQALRLLLVALFCFTFVAPVFAQTKSVRDELSDKHKKMWDNAKELVQAEDWDAARAQYQQVWDESQNPRVLFNLGVCWRETKHFAMAVSTWEKQLTYRDKLSEKEITRAEAAIKSQARQITKLELTSNQNGATLYIKGNKIGVTPFKAPIPIDTGTNLVELKKDGFQTSAKKVTAFKDQTLTLKLDLVPETKKAMVYVTVTGAKNAVVYADGVELGPAPFEGMVKVGDNVTFKAEAKGYLPATTSSKVVYGETLRLTIALTEKQEAGVLTIKVDHDDAQITIDGVNKGKGSWSGTVKAGGHEVIVSKDGYQDWKEDISLKDEEERTVTVILNEDMTSSWVFWAVTGVLIAAGAGVTSYFVLRPSGGSQVDGTLEPGVVPTIFRF